MEPIHIEWSGECVVPPAQPMPADLATASKKNFGSVLDMARRIAHAPWVMWGTIRFDDYPLAYCSYDLADLCHLIVSQDNSCRYCYGTSRAMLRILGRSEADVEKLETNLATAEASSADRAALEYARQLSRANPRPGPREESTVLSSGYTAGAIEELALLASWSVIGNRLMTMLAIQPDPFENVPDKWYSVLVKPLVRQMMKSKRKPGTEQPFAPGENKGMFSKVLDAVDGVPRAKALRQTLNEGYSSPILPLRAKLWMTAVIGRAVGCPEAEADAVRGLIEAGISAEAVEKILRNLSGPELDAMEKALVQVARESVRYQPRVIQSKVNELNSLLSPAQIVEAVGICAYANGMARLSVLLQRC